MRAHEFINEARVSPYKTKNVVREKLFKIAKKYCTNASEEIMATGNVLWRGPKFLHHSTLIDPSKGERKSQNTTNQYTLLMDNSPYMSGWPKRSKSLICTTNHRLAAHMAGMGGTIALLPFDTVKIATCPDNDIWQTTIDLHELVGVEVDYAFINHILQQLGFSSKFNFNELVQYGNSKEAEKEYQEKLKEGYKIPKIKIPFNQIIPYVQQQISPEKAGFSLFDNVRDLFNYGGEVECWFSGPAVVFSRRDFLDYAVWASKNK